MSKLIVLLISGKAESGKDYFADTCKSILEEEYKKSVLKIKYGDMLKYVAKEYYNWDGNKDEKGRFLLQHLGTDIVRASNEDTWVNCVIELVKGLKDEYDVVLVPDTRFINEIERWEDAPFLYYTIRIDRINEDGTPFKNHLTEIQKCHQSEIALDDYKFNYYVENKKKEDVPNSVRCILEEVLNIEENK